MASSRRTIRAERRRCSTSSRAVNRSAGWAALTKSPSSHCSSVPTLPPSSRAATTPSTADSSHSRCDLMRLIRFGKAGEEKPGVLLADGRRIDASGFGYDYDEAFFGGDGIARLGAWIAREGKGAPTVG